MPTRRSPCWPLSSLSRSHNSDGVNFDLCLFNDLNWWWLFSLDNCCPIYHKVFPQENLLSLHIQYVPELLIILHQGFHSVRDSTVFSILPNSKLWSLPVCLTFLILSLTNISYFLVQKDSRVWSHLFIFLFINPASSFSETLIALILFLFLFFGFLLLFFYSSCISLTN